MGRIAGIAREMAHGAAQWRLQV